MKNSWQGKYGPLLIAEIGGNHEGDFDYAMKLTELAIESGADYIKFQIYTGDGLVNPVEGAQRNKHFKKFELSREQHIQLAERCRQSQKGYLASVWQEDAMEWIDPYIDFYKIGSGDLTAYPLLKATAKWEKPILLSTGLSTEKEVTDAVDYLKGINPLYENPDYLGVLQCTSMYPIPNEDANLNVMNSLKEKTNATIGYSDHTEGSKALEIAVAMGAQILEFHFTDDRENKTFRDHKVSLTKEEVLGLIDTINEIQATQGDAQKRPLAVEGDHVVSFRRAVYPGVDIPAGKVIEEKDLITLRPNHGIPANEFDTLIGKTAVRDLVQYEKLAWSYFN
ncbi:MAG: N-acetylneuraminate synthase family protein [Bacteroidota bacterium]